ncbi:transcription-repair coupling factor [Bradyrhizobium sp. SSBR45G]|uniref:DEAD/DEAH box helicase n=1 Tax=unclassified Bradyrhizobium TaxID=2631580 RepID=UPI002342B1D2|nr:MULTISPECIES: DEAD/DEAH box helicase [unclassified Bradyrhizobium]GLH78328.1 transcription-repair coupling factor [Bradyrhizobium sp. SSBR45G]GLH86111.1 transcription-repair coupling factor [Bradyrhizobium sp. SSBR45R]
MKIRRENSRRPSISHETISLASVLRKTRGPARPDATSPKSSTAAKKVAPRKKTSVTTKKAVVPRVGVSSSSPLGLLALHLVTQWQAAGRGGLVFLAENERRAERLASVIQVVEPDCDVLVYPRLNTLPFDLLEPSRDIAGRRSAVLRRLASAKKAILLITTVEAMMERLPLAADWSRTGTLLRVGDAYSEPDLEARFGALGYDLDDSPDFPGGVLFHGNTFEIFPAGARGPFRIEQSRGKIRRIASFNPMDQEVISEFKELQIDPMSERLAFKERARNKSHLFAYCARAKWMADSAVRKHADTWLRTIEDAAARVERDRAYLTRREWDEAASRITTLPPTAPYRATPEFFKEPAPRKALRAFIEDALRGDARVLFVAAVEADLRLMARMSGVKAECCADWAQATARGRREAALLAGFDAGFVVPGRKPLVVITASDVLGSRAHQPQPVNWASTPGFEAVNLPELGSVVVHLQRGLARLGGLRSMGSGGVSAREMVRLVFAGNDAVLVPVAELALIWPYAAELGDTSLDKADGSSWRPRRAAAETEIHVVAKELAKQRSKRRRRPAPKLVPRPATYESFAARFPYFTTPDQAQAIRDVLDDLASGHPMDRIVCGDVGFGKTEVALRAAAAAVLAGKQVAIVVPTTVLARQHVETFRKRFAALGIEVGNLSRVASTAEARQVRDGLKSGELKVVVGTLSLASKDIKFADLGLVIIDEEQHFGAADKALLSSLNKNGHRLWMSATPIPRTLAAGLTGLRDLSVIATPPVHRVPVVTKVGPLSDIAIAAALVREHRRHGQSFVVCPRIQDLDPLLTRIHALAPELRIISLHGKLSADEIDERLMAFVEGNADVLLATNIVESGLDIPRANTIVVCWPERFGLAQLHQLRGRVGRGGIRAFAHFLTEGGSDRSEKRLSVLEELNRPGAGFAISARDLDLRGGGDMLSDRQSGHVQVFGPTLYGHLLTLALDGDHEGMSALWVPELNLPIAELLPSDYVQSEALRLEIYARAARCRTEDEIEELEDETQRRFGSLPPAASNFFAIAKLRTSCRERGIMRLDVGPEAIAAMLLPGRVRKSCSRLLQRDGNRLIYAGRSSEPVLHRIEQFMDLLDD